MTLNRMLKFDSSSCEPFGRGPSDSEHAAGQALLPELLAVG